MSSQLTFTDLDDFDTVQVRAPKEAKRFPCPHCGGTGFYQGVRVHQHKTECFSCKGKGYFKTSPEARAKARAASKANKIKKLKAAQDATKHKLEGARAGLAKWLVDNRDWNDFAASLINQVSERGTLSDRQIEVAAGMMAKTEASRAKRAAEKAEREAAAPKVDLSVIHNMFATAMSNGLRKPRFHYNDLTISRAPDSGVNAGHLYVKDAGEYAGKVTPDGRFLAVRSAREGIMDELMKLAADPLEGAKAHGQQTGSCSCCGRELTNKVSVELGIGPICRARWGL